jgi:putative membrane protein
MKKRNSYFLRTSCFLIISIFGLSSLYAQQSVKLTDPQVASVAVTANQIDVDYAEIALKKSSNADVLNFAKTMVSDHKAVIGQAVDLAKKLNVTPQSNNLTKKLLADAEKTKKQLKIQKGAAFDKAYINNEVAYHKAVIDAVEKVLIPDTDNAELKSLLQTVVPALRTHLSHAEMLQKTLNK